jgi:photosystem II stability/assembly factor-like uncharacterized protein
MKLPSRSVCRWVTPRKCNLFAISLQVEDLDLSHRVRRIARCAIVGFALSLLNIVSIAQTVSPDRLSALQWRLIGPYRGGRVAAVTGASDGITFYFGGVDGGIWKTIDAGITWAPVFDGQPIASIGAVEVAPSDPNVLYVGTGESDIRSALSSGDGVYKSTDAGKTWTNIGLKDSRQISRIVIDPHNPDVVYVGALGHAYAPNSERGVFKSSDGGKTWTHVLDKGPSIGVSDLAIAAANPSVLFAGTWAPHRPPWSTYPPLQGPGGGIYRSTDSGANWTQLTGNGLPDGDWGRVGVAVAPDGKRIYALIDAGKKSGLYRSDDGGNTWTLANSDSRLTSRAWYFMGITVDPNHPDVIYMPNIALYRSEDAGKTIQIVRGAPGGDDYHQLWVDPNNSAHLILGTDQGTTVSQNRGQTWSSWFNQPTAQFYHVATDNEFPYHVYGAQQDTGSIAVPSRTDHGNITGRDWYMVGGGESGWIVPDSSDPNILYASGVYGSVARWDRRTSLSQDITPWPMPNFGSEINLRKYRDPWTPVLVGSPAEKNALYFGTQYVMKTTDGGLHWKEISPDLTGAVSGTPSGKAAGPTTNDNAVQRGFGVIFSIAPSPLKTNDIWAGSDTGLLHLTRDGGATWEDVTPPGLNPWSKIAMIEASRFSPAVAYVAVDRHRLDDQKPYLYRTRDYGKTWQPITNGIAASSFVNAVREDSEVKGLLYAGTELGFYVSFNDGEQWQPLQLNLPVTSVRDITIHDDDLVIATHGRSFWIMDDITSLRQMASHPSAGPRLYQPSAAVRIDNDVFLGSPLPPEEPTAKNPPDGAIIDYYLPSAVKMVTLEISDSSGKLVRRFTSAVKKDQPHPPMAIAERWIPKPILLESTAGAHRFVWDLRWGSSGLSSAEDEEGMSAPRGPRVVPGTYQLKLTVDGNTLTQSLKLTMDPRAQVTTAELNDQLRVGLDIFNQLRDARKAQAEIGAVKKHVAELPAPFLAKHQQLLAEITSVNAQIERIEEGEKSTPGAISGLDSAIMGLGAALRVVENSDRALPSQALELNREASKAADDALADWKRVKSDQLAKLNNSLQGAGQPVIQISEIEQEADYVMSQ